MTKLLKAMLTALLSLLLALPGAYAQDRRAYSQAELDQMLAPVALYPDALLSQVLMASTYPLEVVEAARWSRAHPGVQGDDAVRAVQDQDWDPSVKSLLAFPNLLSRMDEKLDWTKSLGDAFLAQEAQVMDTVQQLRQRARAAGHLLPDERIRVVDDGRTVVIEPATPSMVYVPYYDPWVVYGAWWWPAYPPVVWAPWPGYYAYRPGFYWGAGVGLTVGFFFGSLDWHHRHVRVVHVNNYYAKPAYVRRDGYVQSNFAPGKWQHDPWHRRGVVYRAPEVQRKFAATAPARALRQAPRPAASAPVDRSIEHRESRPQARPDRQRDRDERFERREQRRDDRRGQAMPPAFRASPHLERAPRVAARPAEVRPQPRAEIIQRPQAQPAQPRLEARPQPRMEPRGEHRGGGGSRSEGRWHGARGHDGRS